MLAPKPFFSPIGKNVVHCEILRIFGRAAFASSVVRRGCVTLIAGSSVAVLAPAIRASMSCWTWSLVAA